MRRRRSPPRSPTAPLCPLAPLRPRDHALHRYATGAGDDRPIAARLTFSLPPNRTGGESLVFTDGLALDPAALPAGIAYDGRVALFDLKGGTVAAATAGLHPLPDWLTFAPATRTFGLTGFPPEDGAASTRLQVVFTPGPRVLPDGTVATSDRSFTLEVVVDPGRDLALQAAAINRRWRASQFAARGLFALDLDGGRPVPEGGQRIAIPGRHAPVP